jgi:integrase
MSTLQVDFQKKLRPRLVHIEGGVYQYRQPGDTSDAPAKHAGFYERPILNGKQSVRKLQSTTLRKAKIEVGEKRSQQGLAKIGLAHDPYRAVQRAALVGELIDFYIECKCPRRNEQVRTGPEFDGEKRRLDHLRKFFGNRSADKTTIEDSRDYHHYRKQQIKRGPGDRSVMVELATLSNVFRWALRNQRRTGIASNPIEHGRIQFCRSETVRHCREVQPASGDELHDLARFLFGNPRSEVLGWQALFEAFIGQRTKEILRLRTDATERYQPGFVEGRHLWLHDSKTHKGTFPYVEIHAALRDCLAAFQIWRQSHLSRSPWYFPSLHDPGKPADPTSLTHALGRACKAMGIAHRTSHGLRSYYVNVLRSQGKSDAEIALRIGHRTGGKLIVEVYGEILPVKLSFMPKDGPPAWSIFAPAASQKPVQLELL